MKIHAVGAESCHVDRRTERHYTANKSLPAPFCEGT